MGPTTIGIDIGGTKVLALVVDTETGKVHREHRVPTPPGGDGLVPVLAEVVATLQRDLAVPAGAVGIGAAGLVDGDGVLRTSPNLPAIAELALAHDLQAAVGLPVVVDNDATAATVVEHRLGAAQGIDDALYVALGTGIGGGVVLDGKIRRGAHGFGGEFGHMVVDPNGVECGCGQLGCWEKFASGSALGRLGREAAARGQGAGFVALAPSEEAVEGEHVVAAAVRGDHEALAVLDEFARWIAIGLASLTNALDPALIVIGGGVVEVGELLLTPVRRHFGGRPMGAAHRPEVPIIPAVFGEDSAALGAALLAADQL